MGDESCQQLVCDVRESRIGIARRQGECRVRKSSIDVKARPVQVEGPAIGLARVLRILIPAGFLLEAVVGFVKSSDSVEVENVFVFRERLVEIETVLTDTM